MSMESINLRDLALSLDKDFDRLERMFKALGSNPRLKILKLLAGRLLNVSEVARELGLPISTVNAHVNVLEGAGLLLTEHRPATRGSQKMCTCALDNLYVHFPRDHPRQVQSTEYTMPVGAYVDCQVVPPCGLTGEGAIIGLFDDPESFYETERLAAQLLWFHQGHVEYRFPRRLPPTGEVEGIHLSFEACSEAPLHHRDWPSDISVWINGVEIGTWTSPADFGGQRGKLTPEWWDEHNTQYGLLKVWQVSHEGTKVDGLDVSDVTLSDLRLSSERYVSVQIGVKADARHVGGINLFGRAFGNYPQDITLRLLYR
jgi:predicted transcriptional regulator